jgi:hypothetical protein
MAPVSQAPAWRNRHQVGSQGHAPGDIPPVICVKEVSESRQAAFNITANYPHSRVFYRYYWHSRVSFENYWHSRVSFHITGVVEVYYASNIKTKL